MIAVGPTGGGGSLDINGLTQSSDVDPLADFMPFRDSSGSVNRKVTPRDLLAAMASRIVTANGVIVIANGAVVVS